MCRGMHNKKLSVIVTLYNVELYADRVARSITSQAFKGLEVILVDDGSADRSLEVCVNHLSGVDIIPIRQKNIGPGGARNTGIKVASGEYIMFIDGDDFILPETFENIIAVLEAEQPDVLFGRYMRWMPDAGLMADFKPRFTPLREVNFRVEDILEVFPEPSWNSVWRYVCKREFILLNEIFFDPSMYCEDLKWVLELLDALEKNLGRLSFLQKPFYAYNYIRLGSIMNGTSPKRLTDLTLIVAEALEKYSDRPAMCKELVWQTFYYINQYCTFPKAERKEIYRSYQKVFPLFELSRSNLYYIVSKFRNPVMFYGLSVGMFAVNYSRKKLWRYGRLTKKG